MGYTRQLNIRRATSTGRRLRVYSSMKASSRSESFQDSQDRAVRYHTDIAGFSSSTTGNCRSFGRSSPF